MTIKSKFLAPLHAAAHIAMFGGALGSVGLMLRTGRHNDSRLLLVIFAVWVLSPFAALFLARVVSKRWSALTTATLDSLAVVLALASLALYGAVAFGPPRAKSASIFVIVPPASCLLIAMVVAVAAFVSRRQSRSGSGPLHVA